MSEHDYLLYSYSIPPEVIACVGPDWAHGLRVVPVEFGRTGFVVAMADASPDIGLLCFLLNRPDVEVVRVSQDALKYALDRYYPL